MFIYYITICTCVHFPLCTAPCKLHNAEVRKGMGVRLLRSVQPVQPVQPIQPVQPVWFIRSVRPVPSGRVVFPEKNRRLRTRIMRVYLPCCHSSFLCMCMRDHRIVIIQVRLKKKPWHLQKFLQTGPRLGIILEYPLPPEGKTFSSYVSVLECQFFTGPLSSSLSFLITLRNARLVGFIGGDLKVGTLSWG